MTTPPTDDFKKLVILRDVRDYGRTALFESCPYLDADFEVSIGAAIRQRNLTLTESQPRCIRAALAYAARTQSVDDIVRFGGSRHVSAWAPKVFGDVFLTFCKQVARAGGDDMLLAIAKWMVDNGRGQEFVNTIMPIQSRVSTHVLLYAVCKGSMHDAMKTLETLAPDTDAAQEVLAAIHLYNARLPPAPILLDALATRIAMDGSCKCAYIRDHLRDWGQRRPVQCWTADLEVLVKAEIRHCGATHLIEQEGHLLLQCLQHRGVLLSTQKQLYCLGTPSVRSLHDIHKSGVLDTFEEWHLQTRMRDRDMQAVLPPVPRNTQHKDGRFTSPNFRRGQALMQWVLQEPVHIHLP